MVQRNIQHPGVEIREIDRSQYNPGAAGTYALVCGYADKGEDYNPLQIASMESFEAIYGQPTNDAERYFYGASSEVLKNGGSLITGKLPYENIASTNINYVTIDIANSMPINLIGTTEEAFTNALSAEAFDFYGELLLDGAVSGTVADMETVASLSAFDASVDTSTTYGALESFLTLAVVDLDGISSPTEIVALEAYLQTKIDAIDVPAYASELGRYSAVNTLALSTLDATDEFYDNFTTVEVDTTNSMTMDAYDAIAIGSSQIVNDFILVNEPKNVVDKEGSGIFVQVVESVMGLNVQRNLDSPNLNPDDDIMGIVTDFTFEGNSLVFNEDLSGKYIGDSVSEKLMRQFPPIELDGLGGIDKQYGQYITIVVGKTIADRNNGGRLNVNILESFTGSIFADEKDPSTGQSVYIADVVNSTSQYFTMYDKSTPTIPTKDENTVLFYGGTTTELIGFSESDVAKNIAGASLGSELIKVYNKVSNIDDMQVDLVVDAGLSTIAQFCNTAEVDGELFNPVISEGEINEVADTSNWRSVVTIMDEFCSKTRKDCMAIIDAPRNLVLDGNLKYIRKTQPSNVFGNTIGPRLKYCTGINSSYSAMYINWFKAVDNFTGTKYWLPQSVKMVGIYCYNDSVANIWDAPAGLNRGVIRGVFDIAFNPTGKMADQIYTKSMNYAQKLPRAGFIAEGQRTTQVKPSAFDRVNVRRLFLQLERMVRGVSRYFVYEPNNLFTRRRLVDAITPEFARIKAQGGMYDYQIVCDESNNKPDTIDRNELRVLILIKPVKTAEYILVDFVATGTGADFELVIEELVG